MALIRKIGLTGGMASGKSRVAAMLASMLACPHIDADEVSRRLLEPQAEGWRQLTAVFGRGYLTADGSINRPKLRRDLFSDESFRRQVNEILHPLIRKAIVRQMDHVLAAGGRSQVLVEVPLLYEVGWQDLFDTVVVVYADDGACLNRLMARDNIDRTAAARELASQLPLAVKVKMANHVIDNSGMLPDTRKQAARLADLLRRHDGALGSGRQRGR